MRGAAPGTIPAARDFLGEMSLKGLGTSTEAEFRRHLDDATQELLGKLPKAARHWGRARKGLNIFLRGCLYTCYLRDAHNLHLSEQFFEMPLDSITGAKLVKESNETSLPRWASVKELAPETSQRYQEAAAALGALKGIPRVHLDAIWWGRRTEEIEI